MKHMLMWATLLLRKDRVACIVARIGVMFQCPASFNTEVVVVVDARTDQSA
jgi:hypothetical protein